MRAHHQAVLEERTRSADALLGDLQAAVLHLDASIVAMLSGDVLGHCSSTMRANVGVLATQTMQAMLTLGASGLVAGQAEHFGLKHRLAHDASAYGLYKDLALVDNLNDFVGPPILWSPACGVHHDAIEESVLPALRADE